MSSRENARTPQSRTRHKDLKAVEGDGSPRQLFEKEFCFGEGKIVEGDVCGRSLSLRREEPESMTRFTTIRTVVLMWVVMLAPHMKSQQPPAPAPPGTLDPHAGHTMAAPHAPAHHKM